MQWVSLPSTLNFLDPLLPFTFKKECNRTLPFLDVLIEKNDQRNCHICLQKADFHWPIHSLEFFLPHETEDQSDFDSCPQSSSALFGICSLKWTFLHSYNPDQQRLSWSCNQHCYNQKIHQFHRPTQLGQKKCPVYLHLSWLGNVSMRYERQIKTAVKRCYFAVEPRIVYTTRLLLPAAQKDVLPALYQSNIVYQFLCHCDNRYVGRTSQRPQQRIKQHVPKTILQGLTSQDRSLFARSCKPIRSLKSETSFSAIGHHLF